MTFADIQLEVSDRLGLSSVSALARIGRSINERYRVLTDSVGVQTVQRVTVTATTTIAQRTLTFGPTPTGVMKLYNVYNTASTPPQFLDEWTIDQVEQMADTDPPTAYAVQQTGANSVTVLLSSVPATQYALSADADSNVVTLSGLAVPAFAENFHNLLVYGAMATELDKMEKYDLATVQENRFALRMSDFRMYLAMSAYKDLYQGQTGENGPPVQLL